MKIAKVRDVKTPARGTSLSAGLDFYIPEDFPNTLIGVGEGINIPSGIKVQIPAGHALIAFNKSGVAVKMGLQVGACLIDEDYQGEIHLHLVNIGRYPQVLETGMKIAQFVLVPVIYAEVQVVDEAKLYTGVTERGEGGFGSTDTMDPKGWGKENRGECEVCGLSTFGRFCNKHSPSGFA